MANYRKRSPVRDRILVEMRSAGIRRRPVRDEMLVKRTPATNIPRPVGSEICRKYIAYLRHAPIVRLHLFSTNIKSLTGHCTVDTTLYCKRVHCEYLTLSAASQTDRSSHRPDRVFRPVSVNQNITDCSIIHNS
jgi:hypothetical protein